MPLSGDPNWNCYVKDEERRFPPREGKYSRSRKEWERERERESERAGVSRSTRRLYFNESSLRPTLKLSSFQRQYRDHIDSKVIFRIPSSPSLNSPSLLLLLPLPPPPFLEFPFLMSQLNPFRSLDVWAFGRNQIFLASPQRISGDFNRMRHTILRVCVRVCAYTRLHDRRHTRHTFRRTLGMSAFSGRTSSSPNWSTIHFALSKIRLTGWPRFCAISLRI